MQTTQMLNIYQHVIIKTFLDAPEHAAINMPIPPEANILAMMIGISCTYIEKNVKFVHTTNPILATMWNNFNTEMLSLKSWCYGT